MPQAWDYVIAGAGSAGAVLAARLSENPAIDVAVVEAGPNYRSPATPAGFRTRDIDMSVDANPEFWWPKLQAQRSPVQEPYHYPQGRGVGGSSTVNGLCAIRGIPGDYDRWAQDGADGWSFADVLPSFVKLEDEHDYGDAEYHGAGGPVPVYREPEDGWGGMDLAFRDAALDLGYSWCPDHNAPDATGVSPFAMNVRDGRRVSTNDGYLEPARTRPNLSIRGDSQVDTVLFHADRRTVRGVRLVGGDEILVKPGGEVILSCGASHSPAVLMRSGIGSARDLEELGIRVVRDLPVGRGLQDHAMLLIKVPTSEEARRSRDGRVTNCILRYSSGLGGAGRNDMMLLPNNGAKHGMSMMVLQQEQVFSRGSLALLSRDPESGPIIRQNLLADDRDLIRMRDAVERTAELLDQKAFRAITTGPVELPGATALRAAIGDTVHLCSTCRMGAPRDPGTVVDPSCRVLGVDGLRVIDASVMPSIPRANLLLTVVMIAEHMAARLMTGV